MRAVPRRVRARVSGTVQGVGFRPHVYRLGRRFGLAGFVRNDARGVVVEAEGASDAVGLFLASLAAEAPPLAIVETVAVEEMRVRHASGFEIARSDGAGAASALVAPDVATCDACLRELFDPADRRYRYPFVCCTDCGPRFTIVRGTPYDRHATTMAPFALCDACRAEYEDPGSRRFHAEPTACPACGPRLALLDDSGLTVEGDGDPVSLAARALAGGAIVAVKGVGGYHLACAACDAGAVARLRARKHREEKPFAVMVGSIGAAAALADLDAWSASALAGRQRPIVLVPRRLESPLAAGVAPGCREIGLMLPYSPLHHLLLGDLGEPLVLTSGNRSSEPIAHRDADAVARLRGVADLFLVHDRAIHARADDSVVRVVAMGDGDRRPLLLRRSRGFAPASLELPVEAEPAVLACGAQDKATFCLARGTRAWVSQHVGDLDDWETLRSYEECIDHFRGLFAIEPRVVAHDLHPDYRSTAFALDMDGVEHVGVQHHHAHLAACLAEHRETGPAVGIIFDGAGYGSDGTIWGGEILAGDLEGFERAAWLLPVALPGGDAAVREPWRMACAWLEAASVDAPAPLADLVDPVRWRAVRSLIGAHSTPRTSSVGRLFDAVAALCGLRVDATYEGQAAIALEAVAALPERGQYDVPILVADGGPERTFRLDARPAIRAIVRDLDRGVPPAAISMRFHRGLAESAARAARRIAARRGIATVVLSGGVFQNRIFLEATTQCLRESALRILVPEAFPPNDGGIALGQAAVAAAQMARRRRAS
jgi:hydrogenase maturation protein HypF